MLFGTKKNNTEPENQYEANAQINTEIRKYLADKVLTLVNPDAAVKLNYEELLSQVERAVGQIASDERLTINGIEQKLISEELANDMLGIGPLEPLMKDDEITDIMVVGPNTIYVDRRGKGRELSGLSFRDGKHLIAVGQRIARNVGRKIDENTPLVDARLQDGSRVNIVFPPITLDGASISIRKFPKETFQLADLQRVGSFSQEIGEFLKLAAEARLNFVISGGTGSGKTTLLNAMTKHFSQDERIVTIEDAAELKILMPHVVRMETRASSSEGNNQVNQTALVKNSLRMNPDRIIIGEVRGGEAFDFLQAANTGHDGSCASLHANTCRDALSRLENMVLMAGYDLPARAIRGQIASAIDLVIQIERLKDKKRRITSISEVIGMEGEVISLQELFKFKIDNFTTAGVEGHWKKANVKPRGMDKFRAHGLEYKISEIFGKQGG